MTDAEYNVQKKRLTALQKKWLLPLGLRWWKVTFSYSREPLKSDEAEGRTCLAQTLVDWEYLKATVTFDMQCIADESDEDLEETFVHECMHIFVHEMRMWAGPEVTVEKQEEAMKHEERVVTQLANAVIWTRQTGFDEGKKTPRTNKKKR